MSATLSVWWNGRVAGALRLDRHGDMGFTYAPDWLADAISPALSRSEERRVGKEC